MAACCVTGFEALVEVSNSDGNTIEKLATSTPLPRDSIPIGIYDLLEYTIAAIDASYTSIVNGSKLHQPMALVRKRNKPEHEWRYIPAGMLSLISQLDIRIPQIECCYCRLQSSYESGFLPAEYE